MYTILLITIALSILIGLISSQSVCLGVATCNNGDVCSENGRCYYSFVNQIWNYNQNKSLNKTNVTQVYYYEPCICNEGYSSLPNDLIKCCYEQKDQLYGFLLEFFIGFGTGHFYINQYQLAVAKLVCNLFFCCYCYIVALCIYVKDDNKETSLIQKVFNSILILNIVAFVVWWFVDVIMFGFNMYSDGNNVPLSPW